MAGAMVWSRLLTVCLCAVVLGCGSAHLYGTRGSNLGVSSSKQLMCHDCSGADCLRLISRGWGGRCRTRKGLPKCFVRKDPNGLVYRGCADHSIWPSDLDLDYNGCQTQRYGDWSEKKVTWCLCDYAYCNVNITVVTAHYGQRDGKLQPQQQQSDYYKPYVSRYQPKPKPYISEPVWAKPYVQEPKPYAQEERSRYHVSHQQRMPNYRDYHVQQPPTQHRRPQQKRVMFYKPLGYPDSQYVEPIDKPQPPQRPQSHPADSQPWYDVRTPAKNQPWVPPAKEITRKDVHFTSPSPVKDVQHTRPVVFTTSQPKTAPLMANDLGPFESREPEGKIGDDGLNDINTNFDLSKIPDWLWEKIIPRLDKEDEPETEVGNIFAEDLPPNEIEQAPVPGPAAGPAVGATACATAGAATAPTPGPTPGPAPGHAPGPAAGPNASNTASPYASHTAGPGASPAASTKASPTTCPTTSPTASPAARHAAGLGHQAWDPRTRSEFNLKQVFCSMQTNPCLLARDPHTCKTMKCDHDCLIKEGHPYCTCPAGYRLRKDARTCEDVDECSIRNGDCSHDCRNSVGTYQCACPGGYELDVDRKTCQDYNECNMVKCQHGCRNIAGSYECTCRPGYLLNTDGKTCDDLDECRENTHSCDHICVNNVGSYTCDCNHGFHLDTNDRTCRDSNECRVENGGCEQRCQNTAGSYECYCNIGYVLNVDGKTCDDVDECRRDNGGCTHTCWNLAGSYECQCNTGYTLDTNQHSCIDMNECLEENGGCHQICENVHGSFRCLCREGASLNVDQRTCDAVDKCSQNNGGCEHVCSTTPSGARCSCHRGYMLRTDAHTCADINECQRTNGGCDHVCVNTVGSYRCTCRAGYTLNVDNVTCDDIDECARNLGGCSQRCENILGSYRCACEAGYQLTSDNRLCQDINECQIENGGCQQNCTNTLGSFKCKCDGIIYRLHADGRRCIGTCPSDFIKNEELSSCYKVFTPRAKDETTAMYSQDVASAQEHCRSLHPLGGLVSIQSDKEKQYLSTILKKETQMLEGWQGWWTSGNYHSGLNLFQWSDGTYIGNDSPHWGFRKTPVADTCVWVLQISVYNQTWGNYDCFTKSGHICEVELASK